MSTVYTRDDIFRGVCEAIVGATGVAENEVIPEATLIGDLGLESIDFLDVVFRLEKHFDIKIPRGELFPEGILTDMVYVRDGRITPAGIVELRRRTRFFDLDSLGDSPMVRDFANIFTVRGLCRYIESKVPVKT